MKKFKLEKEIIKRKILLNIVLLLQKIKSFDSK